MNKIIAVLFSSLLYLNCQPAMKEQKHIFYLHGRIIELQGINAVSDAFGEYKYNDIIDSLKIKGMVMHNEIRTNRTDFQEFCIKTSKQIDELVKAGIDTKNITVIGASKGAIMAMNISNMNSNPINYVLLAANNDQLEHNNDWNLHGRILGIYEKTDAIAGKNYSHWINTSTNALLFEHIEINTGLGHGFLYTPLKEWLNPTKKWIEN